MKLFTEKKGMGMIGVFMLMGLVAFFWTMFYIVLNQMFRNFLPALTDDAATIVFFNANHLVIWGALPFIFLIALCLWAIIQTQNPYNTFVIGGIWVAIILSFFIYSALFINFDHLMMVILPNLLPMDAAYSSFYTNFVMVIWRAIVWPLGILLCIFGTFMAPAYFEMGGRTRPVTVGGF